MSILWTPVTGNDRAPSLQSLQQILRDPPGFVRALDDDHLLSRTEVVATTVPAEDSILLLGIGGSVLGTRALVDALVTSAGRLTVLDNIDPDGVDRIVSKLDMKRTTVLVISKSGSTVETSAQLLRIIEELKNAGVDPDEKIIAITDPQHGPLRAMVNSRGWRALDVPPDVGGRYSVMTAVGWLPATLCGIDIHAIRDGARAALADLRSADMSHSLVRWISGWAQHHAQRKTVVMFPYRDRLRTFGDWFAQLWAESLGKRHDLHGAEVWAGSTPMIARGVTDQHSLVQLFAEGPDDKQYLFLDAQIETADPPINPETATLHDDLAYLGGKSLGQLHAAEQSGTMAALSASGRPVSKMTLENLDAQHLGALMLTWEMATLMAAAALQVDPFDQPGVEAGKAVAFAKMGREGWDQRAQSILAGAQVVAPAPPIPVH